tara:strand:+ start:124 stop:897 length:774 start_codon:yes stop_codon:yes gene_type:complete
MAYNFGEVILDSIDKGKKTTMAASELKMRKEQAIRDNEHKAKVLAEAVETRKQTNEIQKAVNKMKEDQLVANLTGMYQGQPTWARQTYEEGKTIDMSVFKPWLTSAQQESLKEAGVDLTKVDSRYSGLLGPIIGSQLQTKKEARQVESALLPPAPWKNPEGTDKDWGLGIDQGEIRDEARTYLDRAKADAAIWKSVRKNNPKSSGYQAYIKELRSLKADLDSKDYFKHSGNFKNWPANVDARNMSKEITDLILFLEG